MKSLTGWRAFLTLWGGQTVSMIGSGLFAFAIGVWVYQRTGSATLFGLILFFDMMPGILAAPYAGVVADRMNRRTLMLLGDTGAAISSLAVAAIAFVDDDASHVWLMFLPLAFGGVAAAFHGAAFEASFALLVEEKHLGRANGLMQLSFGLAEVLAPLLGGVLMVTFDLWTVILADVATFLVSLAALSLIRIPDAEPVVEEEEEEAGVGLRREVTYGLRYIRRRSGLVVLLLIFSGLNFAANLMFVGITPMVLSFANAAALGTIAALGGAGMIVGGLLMGVWGGTKRKVVGLLGGAALVGVFAIVYGLRPSIVLAGIGAFGFFFFLPVINASSAAIWQAKVAPGAQGRVFAVRRVIAQASAPIAFLVGGFVIDRLFRDLLSPPGRLADVLGPVFGTGEGRGIGVLFALVGMGMIGLALLGWLNPSLRSIEDEEPPAADLIDRVDDLSDTSTPG